MVSKLNFVYRPVLTNDRLPDKPGFYFTSDGLLYKNKDSKEWSYYDRIDLIFKKVEAPEWWLEEIELPTEEEINKPANDEYVDSLRGYSAFKKGAEWVINKIKGGK